MTSLATSNANAKAPQRQRRRRSLPSSIPSTPKNDPRPPSAASTTRTPPHPSARAMYQSPQRQQSSKQQQQKQQRLFFESPRCDATDKQLFESKKNLQQHDARWKHLQGQAGQHSQKDVAVQHVNVRRTMTPTALQKGMPLQAAARVQTLYLELNDQDDRLPAWMDVICSVYLNLEHLYLGDNSDSADNDAVDDSDESDRKEAANSDSDDDSASTLQEESPEEWARISNRMRRLYIVYRMPDLKSVNGQQVTMQERLLARPDHPNGQRVKRDEWVESSLLDNEDDDGECCSDAALSDAVSLSAVTTSSPHVGDAVEVDLTGMVKLVPAKTRSTGRAVQELNAECESVSAGDAVLNPPPPTASVALEQRQQPCPQMPELSVPDDLRNDVEFEYDAVTDTGTSAACEWSAACGLSLPYFRGESARRAIMGAPKIRLAFGRKNREAASKEPSSKEPVLNEQEATKDTPAPVKALVKDAFEEEQRATDDEAAPLSPLAAIPEAEKAPATPALSEESYNPSQEIEMMTSPAASMSPSPQAAAPRLPVNVARFESVAVPPAPTNASLLKRTFDDKGRLSPNKHLPPSKSLSSPFPMQFRMSARIGQSPARELSVTTKLNSEGDATNGLPPPPPPPPLGRRRSPSDFERETIESPVELVRVQSSPSKLSQNGRKVIASNRGDLPPPCPGGRRTPVSTPKRKERKKKRGPSKWREKLSARSSSIMDDGDDDDDHDDKKDDEDHSDSGEFSSDEENIVVAA